MELFAVICETCTARLKVRDARAIGQILACPKCGGMVQIAPPAGWVAPSSATLAAHANDSGASSGSTIQFKLPVSSADALAAAAAQRRAGAAAAPLAGAPSGSIGAGSSSGSFDLSSLAQGAAPAASSEIANLAAAHSAAPANTEAPAAESAPASAASRALAGAFTGALARASGAGQSMARNWIYWLCGPIAAIALVLVGWIVYQSTAPKTQVAAIDPAATNSVATEAPAAAPATPDETLDRAPGDVDPANPNAETATPADPQVGAPVAPMVDPIPAAENPADPNEATPDVKMPGAAATTNNVPNEALPVSPQPAPPKTGGDEMPDEAGPDGAAPDMKPDKTTPNEAGPKAAAPNESMPAAAAEKTPQGAEEAPKEGADEEDPEATQPTISSPVDVPARLQDPIERVEFRRILLADFCDFISDLSTIPITLDVDALATIGVPPDEPLSAVSKSRTTVGDLLSSVLEKHGLIYEIEGQQLLVTTNAGAMSTVKYEVGELAGADGTEKLAVLVTRFVVPASWQSAGGKGNITAAEKTLIVEQIPAVHQRVRMFLERLRVARGGAPRGAKGAGGALTTTKYARAKDRLQTKVSGTYGIETPLSEVLDWLGRASGGTRILIDGISLTQVERTRRSPVTLVVDKQSLDVALTSLLDPLDLTFRVVDDKTLQVYAKKPGSERFEFELHPVGELTAKPDKILEVVREKIEPQSWIESGGAGVIEYDAASKSLLVLQSPVAQIRLEKMLDKSRSGAAPARRAP